MIAANLDPPISPRAIYLLKRRRECCVFECLHQTHGIGGGAAAREVFMYLMAIGVSWAVGLGLQINYHLPLRQRRHH